VIEYETQQQLHFRFFPDLNIAIEAIGGCATGLHLGQKALKAYNELEKVFKTLDQIVATLLHSRQ